MMSGRKTKTVKMSYCGRRFWTVTAMLVFCLALFCSNAGATLLNIINIDGSYVIGIDGTPSPINGSDFGVVGAIASGRNAIGIYGDGYNVVITGDVGSASHIFSVATAQRAYAIGNDGGYSIITDALNGTIDATAGGWDAIGLYTMGGGSITTGAIGGSITAASADDGAYGLRSDNGGLITVNGDISGMITATAYYTDAYGFQSSGGSVDINGTISGTIAANATYDKYAYGVAGDVNVNIRGITGKVVAKALDSSNGYDAYGLYAGTNLTVGNIGNDANISAQVGYSDAYGLYAGKNLSVGDINGVVNATAGHSGAYGLYSGETLSVGNINGAVHATAGHNGAYGLYSEDGSVTTGVIRGTITADAGYHGAYGIYASGDLTINGTVDDGAISNSAVIRATSGDDYSGAHALYSDDGDIIINGDVNGTITATSGANAYGLESSNGSIYINGAINGTITATATNGNNAYGIFSPWGSITTGNIDGHIDANTSGGYARGMFGWEGIT
ncbi:MAG: hypothetical protein ABSG22_11900, partial [Sedimentisphaerales bacterium]